MNGTAIHKHCDDNSFNRFFPFSLLKLFVCYQFITSCKFQPIKNSQNVYWTIQVFSSCTVIIKLRLDWFCSWLCDLTFVNYFYLLKSCFDYTDLSTISKFAFNQHFHKTNHICKRHYEKAVRKRQIHWIQYSS